MIADGTNIGRSVNTIKMDPVTYDRKVMAHTDIQRRSRIGGKGTLRSDAGLRQRDEGYNRSFKKN